MYKIIKDVILSGRYELSDMLKKIDTLWLQGDLTDEQKSEIVSLAQGNANVSNSIYVNEKLLELDKRITALENSTVSETPTEEYLEYVTGKWYYKDDKVLFEGKNYICVAPDGQVCTWSPIEYPTYWEEV